MSIRKSVYPVDEKGRLSLNSDFRNKLPEVQCGKRQVFFIVDRTLHGITQTLNNSLETPIPPDFITAYGETPTIEPLGVFCSKRFAEDHVQPLDLSGDDFTQVLLTPRRFDCLEQQVDSNGRTVIPSLYRPKKNFEIYAAFSPELDAIAISRITSAQIKKITAE